MKTELKTFYLEGSHTDYITRTIEKIHSYARANTVEIISFQIVIGGLVKVASITVLFRKN